ncbi:hypothetical protein KUTeg_005154 [Tegillarca granosa]|uniref:Amine oxidase domain-containing protein n=1 Tax=Tegillarca granosa TaxID=220873 RepID=A0ABQ9FNG2_TEGGR|nr:hypothetical protein KUTeg_005154 [Tegillarca granosa]
MYISCWFCVMESQQNGPLCLKNEPKIVIIGAGISGLAAAEHLAKSGFSDFVILEASGRTGGRIYTVELVDKVILHFDEAITEPDVFRLELLWDSDNVEINDLRHTWYRKIYSFEIIYDNVLVVSHFCAHIKVCQILNMVIFPELYIVHSCMFIIAWLSGKEALYMESLTEEQVGQDLVEVLKKILRKTDIPQPSKVTRTRWGNNPNTRGSYSFIQVGATVQDIEVLADPIVGSESDKPQIMFAGEATHLSMYSTTHGALLTGYREAKRIVDMYSH